MDTDSVARFLPEESERKRPLCRPGRRFFCILIFVAFVTLTVLFCIVLGLVINDRNKLQALQLKYNDIRDVKEGNKGLATSKVELKSFIDAKMNSSMSTTANKLEAYFNALDNSLQIHESANRQFEIKMNASYANVTRDIAKLVNRTGDIIANLTLLNNSSNENLANLRNVFKGIRDDLDLTRKNLTRDGASIRDNLAQINSSFGKSVKYLKKTLNKLKSFNAKENQELWKYWNRTNTEFEKALKQLDHHNSTLHLKIEYHSKALNSEVKTIEKIIRNLKENNTVVAFKDRQMIGKLQKRLEETARSLKDLFRKNTSTLDGSFRKKLNDFRLVFNKSVEDLSARTKAENENLRENITNLKSIDETIVNNMSKLSATLVTENKRLNYNISALAVNITNLRSSYDRMNSALKTERAQRKNLEEKLHNLQITVDKLENASANVKKTFLLWIVLAVTCFMGEHVIS